MPQSICVCVWSGASSKDKHGCSVPYSQRRTNKGKNLETVNVNGKAGTTTCNRNMHKTAPMTE